MKITSVKKNPEQKNTLILCIDDDYTFDLSEENYLKYGLYEEKELSHEDIDTIKRLQKVEEAKQKVLQYLQYKLRSSSEVFNKIVSDGYDRNIATTVIEDFKALGYLNDSIYVQKYLYDRTKLHPKSRNLLKEELHAKGIEERIIDEILPEWKLDDATTARVLVKKKFGKYDLTDEKIIKKLFYFLRHRGFSFEIIENLINDISKGNKL
ncbi:MAG: regulatory protein RecX [Eubacteriales bacterium]|nr:regulatory protein RecX [Eubacteriales bacterium]